MTASNRHPVDRMAEIKTEVAALETEFAAMRELVITGGRSDRGQMGRNDHGARHALDCDRRRRAGSAGGAV